VISYIWQGQQSWLTALSILFIPVAIVLTAITVAVSYIKSHITKEKK